MSLKIQLNKKNERRGTGIKEIANREEKKTNEQIHSILQSQYS